MADGDGYLFVSLDPIEYRGADLGVTLHGRPLTACQRAALFQHTDRYANLSDVMQKPTQVSFVPLALR